MVWWPHPPPHATTQPRPKKGFFPVSWWRHARLRRRRRRLPHSKWARENEELLSTHRAFPSPPWAQNRPSFSIFFFFFFSSPLKTLLFPLTTCTTFLHSAPLPKGAGMLSKVRFVAAAARGEFHISKMMTFPSLPHFQPNPIHIRERRRRLCKKCAIN